MTYKEKVDAKVEDVRAHPERHRHDFNGLQRCCIVDGILDTRIMDAHETHASTGSNGGRRCDVTRGPCSCGAWH